jgi:hypothetical protein
MTGRVSIVAALAAAVAVAWAGAYPATAAKPDPLAAATGVQLLECSTGKQASKRFAIFRGSMAQIPAGQGMRIQYALDERIGRGVWRRVSAPGLNAWHAAQPGVRQFAYRQKIDALQPATSYRVHVTFEWLDAAGKTLERTVKRSPSCRQPGRLPNLHSRGALSVDPGPTDETRLYTVQVRNTGTAAARRVEVRLRVDGGEVDVRAIGTLQSRESRAVRFVGPVCGASVEVEVDPRDRVREITERDNTLKLACPTP